MVLKRVNFVAWDFSLLCCKVKLLQHSHDERIATIEPREEQIGLSFALYVRSQIRS